MLWEQVVLLSRGPWGWLLASWSCSLCDFPSMVLGFPARPLSFPLRSGLTGW